MIENLCRSAGVHTDIRILKALCSALLACVISTTAAVGSESDLDDPLENLVPNTPAPNTTNSAKHDSQKDSSGHDSRRQDSGQDSSKGVGHGSTDTDNSPSAKNPESKTPESKNPKPQDPAAPDSGDPAESKGDRVVAEVDGVEDFLSVQKRFPWIKSVGLVMVSFDDGSFRSGFGLLLPEQIFLTSAELGHSAHAYPKSILLKMRDESAGNLICVAELRLKALDKILGLALFEVSGYTDDHCNLRSQSYYHSKILSQAYDITKHKSAPKSAKPRDYYSVTTTFNNPNISVLSIPSAGGDTGSAKSPAKTQPKNPQQKPLEKLPQKLPIEDEQRIVYGRPFFDQSGSLLGIATMPNNAISPVIVGDGEIKRFLCGIDKSGFIVGDFVAKICR